MVNFNDIANQRIEDIERPPLVPIGTYVFQVEKHPEQGEVGQGRFDVVNFQMKVVRPTEDVDEEAVAEYGDITTVRIRHSFMFNKEDEALAKRTLYNLKRFLSEHLLIDGSEGMTVTEALSAAVGHQCLGEIKWRPDPNDPSIQYAEIKRTAPVE